MRKVLCALALALALAAPAFAGVIHIPPQDPSPPPTQEPETDGEMHYPLVQLALDLFALI